MLTPDSLFQDELRSGWYAALQFRPPGWGTLRFSTNLRSQSESDELSVYFAADYILPSMLKRIDLDVRTAWLRNLTITGLRNRVSLSMPLQPRMRTWAEIELYLYGYGSKYTDYARSSLLGGLSWQLRPTLHLTASAELVVEVDYRQAYAFSGLSYRF